MAVVALDREAARAAISAAAERFTALPREADVRSDNDAASPHLTHNSHLFNTHHYQLTVASCSVP
jgi:hypothetical protein